jgi:anti-sigma factor RsiW
MSLLACRRLRPALVDLALGTLGAAEARQVEVHVASCRRCRDDLAAMRALPGALDGVTPTALPDAFWLRQRQAIMRRVRTAAAPAAAPRRWAPAWQLTGALATIVLALLVTHPPLLHRGPALPRAVDRLDDDALLHLHDLLPTLTPAVSADDADGDVLAVHDLADDELDSLADILDDHS